jgi:hypothetical protein
MTRTGQTMAASVSSTAAGSLPTKSASMSESITSPEVPQAQSTVSS